jgi:hypothetical protein
MLTVNVKDFGLHPFKKQMEIMQLPDKFIIIARKRLSEQGPQDSSTFMAISKVSINFNNSSGLLSSATQQDLLLIASTLGCQTVRWVLRWSRRSNGIQLMAHKGDFHGNFVHLNFGTNQPNSRRTQGQNW